MKRKRTISCMILAGFMFVLMISFAHASPVVRLELVDSPPIYSGSAFEVQVLADVGTYEIVAFGFDVVWEAGYVMYSSAVVANSFSNTSSSFDDIDVAGVSNPIDGIITGDNILLATLSFTTHNPGNTSVGIFSNLSDLSELNEGLFFPCPTPRIDMSTSMEISVSEIPLPPALLLLGSGLATLALIRRKA